MDVKIQEQIILNMLDSWMWETHGCENVGFMDAKDSWMWKCWIHGCEDRKPHGCENVGVMGV